MKTSQSAYGNTDGATSFYYNESAAKLTCTAMESMSAGGGRMVSDVDGTYGRKLFYEARGYAVTDCYYQRTNYEGGFSLDNFAEIDAGHPVMINLKGIRSSVTVMMVPQSTFVTPGILAGVIPIPHLGRRCKGWPCRPSVGPSGFTRSLESPPAMEHIRTRFGHLEREHYANNYGV